MTAFAVALGVGRVVPALSHSARLPYTIIGVGFAALGVFFILMAFWRQREVEHAIRRGRFAPPEERIIAGLAVAGLLLGAATLFVIAIDT